MTNDVPWMHRDAPERAINCNACIVCIVMLQFTLLFAVRHFHTTHTMTQKKEEEKRNHFVLFFFHEDCPCVPDNLRVKCKIKGILPMLDSLCRQHFFQPFYVAIRETIYETRFAIRFSPRDAFSVKRWTTVLSEELPTHLFATFKTDDFKKMWKESIDDGHVWLCGVPSYPAERLARDPSVMWRKW